MSVYGKTPAEGSKGLSEGSQGEMGRFGLGFPHIVEAPAFASVWLVDFPVSCLVW